MNLRLPIRVVCSVAVIGMAAVLPSVQQAAANDPPFVGWTAAMPALAFGYDPSSSDACVSGRVACVKETVRQMRTRFAPLAQRCDHDAVFSLAYLRTTEEYLRSTQTAGFFREPRLINHEDVAFARMYFQAYDDWHAGRIEMVPPAWRVALAAADSGQVNGAGDLLLQMNAHINRDLPFVLAATGLVAPDGFTRKGDHDQINVMLNRVVEPLVKEEAARFDPDIATISVPPYGVGHAALLDMIMAWRETAWRQAERLVAAPSAAAEQLVAQEIEDYAELQARAFVAETAYHPPLTTTAARDTYCAVNGTPAS